MRQYTIEELVNEYEKKDFVVFLYNEAIDEYVCGNDDLDKDLLEWQYIKNNVVVDVMEENNEVVLFFYEEEEEPEEEETEKEWTREEWEAYSANLERDERGFCE